MRTRWRGMGLVLCLGMALGCGGSSTPSGGQDAGGQEAGGGQDAAAAVDTGAGQDVAVALDTGVAQDSAVAEGGHAPADHTESMNGVMHKPGKENPLVNCTTCHGADLRGGSGPSCYTCHNNDDHTVIRGGVKHRSGADSTCNSCHGPSNSGGLGPACNQCH